MRMWELRRNRPQMRRKYGTQKTTEDSGSDTGQFIIKKQDHSKATYDSTRHCKQFDYVLMNRAMFKHCKDAETNGQIDMNSNHTPVIARIELPINHKIQQKKNI